MNDDLGSAPVVDMDGVAKVYGSAGLRVEALKPAEVRIDRGDYVAIIGPSGSGKSTLLNVLGLLDEPTAGEYRLDGTPTAKLTEADRCALRAWRIGFVFQAFHLVAYRSAVENVETGLLYQHVGRSERRRRCTEMLERVGLHQRRWAAASELSGGERQRVAIARALVRRPSLLLCDEPTGNLDSTTGRAVLDLVDELSAEGQTVLVVTHDPAVAARAQRTIEITDGQVRNGRLAAVAV